LLRSTKEKGSGIHIEKEGTSYHPKGTSFQRTVQDAKKAKKGLKSANDPSPWGTMKSAAYTGIIRSQKAVGRKNGNSTGGN